MSKITRGLSFDELLRIDTAKTVTVLNSFNLVVHWEEGSLCSLHFQSICKLHIVLRLLLETSGVER